MNLLFLQDLGFGAEDLTSTIGASPISSIPAINPLLAGMIFVALVVFLIIYLYFTLAFMAIGKKAGLSCPGVAWINPIVTVFEVSKMHWWPWPMLVIGYLIGYGLLFLNAILGLVFMFVPVIIFTVMAIVWHWKTFEAIKKPGWWALIPVISGILGLILMAATFISLLASVTQAGMDSALSGLLAILGIIIWILGFLTYAILIGIAAWSKS